MVLGSIKYLYENLLWNKKNRSISICFFYSKLLYFIREHHPRKEVFYDMTVCHPVSRIAHIYKNIYILVFGYENGIFPDRICIYRSILVEH